MGTNQTMAKMKYNKATYKRYEFNVRQDSKLYALIERYKLERDSNVSELVKLCLCEHFGIDRDEAEYLFVPYRFGAGNEQIPNNDLDKYFKG